MRKMLFAVGLVAVLTALVATVGCTRVRLRPAADTRLTEEARTVALEGATQAEVEIKMAVGELDLSTDASSTDLLAASFTYRPVAWKPEVSYAVSGGTGQLSVRQPDGIDSIPFGDAESRWALRLGGGVPTRLKMFLGVGSNKLDLRGANLSYLEVLTGVGDTTIDLSGPRASSMNGLIEAGIGSLVIELPRSVGVRVVGRQEGIGDFSADGFKADGDSWVNDAYAGTGPKIDLRLNRGVGEVTLEMVD